ncbi:MAG: cation:proton antiporter [Gemmatirosa sp.]
MDHFAATIALIGIVIVVASLLSGAIERSGVPIVAIFLALGALLGPWGLGLVDIGFESPALHALSMLGLALVLFSDAVTIETTELRARRPLLWRLLGPGTLFPAMLVTLAARWLLDVSWPAAAILGAAIASTDPVLLRSLLRSPALPATPRAALRIETGMNDVVLLPIVVLAMLWMQAEGEARPVRAMDVTRSIAGLFVLGPALGAAVGWLGIRVLARVRGSFGVRRDYESLYALGLAFSAFAVAEGVGGSGFLAAFAAGLMVGSQDVELCDCFLEYGEATAEMLLLLTFVALGTSLVWTGLTVIDGRTLLFAAVALGARTAVLYPVLARAGVHGRDRTLIALFGPRGLSSLLLVLLPVFAGIAGAERLFTITCLVVLLSIVLHGTGIALFLRGAAEPRARARSVPVVDAAPGDAPGDAPSADVPELITLDEVGALQARGEPYVLLDARRESGYRASEAQAAGAVRVRPEDPVRDATERRLSQRATLVVYCA